MNEISQIHTLKPSSLDNIRLTGARSEHSEKPCFVEDCRYYCTLFITEKKGQKSFNSILDLLTRVAALWHSHISCCGEAPDGNHSHRCFEVVICSNHIATRWPLLCTQLGVCWSVQHALTTNQQEENTDGSLLTARAVIVFFPGPWKQRRRVVYSGC